MCPFRFEVAMTNPYEAPPDLHVDQPIIGRRSTVGIEFESDWSPSGLKLRRKTGWHRMLDAGYAMFSMLWAGSLILSSGSPYAGLFCLLTPMWILFSVVWFSNLSFRSGESFHKKYPGLSGTVRGRVDDRYVVVHGPSVSLATRIRHCIQCSVTTTHALLQPPGIETSLPVHGNDIIQQWPTKRNATKVTQSELLNQFTSEGDAIRIEGTLYGSDLRPYRCWRIWRWSGLICLAIGTIALLWTLVRALGLPAWILNPPDHYRLSDDDISRVMGPALVGIFGLGSLAAGFWQWSRTWRKIGRFAVSVQPDRVSITNDVLALSYHHEALEHFQWTDGGLVARDCRQRVLFAIPAAWFDESSKQSLQSWFDQSIVPPIASHYLGPKL